MAETMTSARPPAPEELAYNLHHLVAHNAATPPYDRSSDAAYPRSQPASSRFASPLPAQMSAMHDQYLSPGYGQSPEMYGDDVGLGIHYVSFVFCFAESRN